MSDIDIDKSWYFYISMTIDAGALKFVQNVNLIKKLLRKKFGDRDLDLSIDIDIDKSWYYYISMTVDARALNFLQNVDLI